jgi:hypothetical protein
MPKEDSRSKTGEASHLPRPQDPPKDAAPVYIVEAADWDKLEQRLQSAQSHYRSAKNSSEQREAWAEALCAVSDLLRDYQNSIPIIQMFTELVGGLGDLNEGRHPSSLRPNQNKPRRSRPNKAIADQASAVAMIDGLLLAGVDEQTAGKRIAELAERLGCELPNAQRRQGKDRTSDHVRLLNWRKEVGRAQADPRYKMACEIRDYWREQRNEYAQKHRCDPKASAEAMIKFWSALHKPKRPPR